uniref:THAP domain-containing protein 1 n=1 Tax=Salarias fasciatus TaxID=181472 RepID=A0A672H139_SALFA
NYLECLCVLFSRFPLYNARKLKKWLVNMKWEDWTPTRFSVLCINHFEDQYINRAGKSVTLRDDAVPTLFSENTQKEKPERWRVVMDEKLMKIKSFPHFFHGDYCVPQSACSPLALVLFDVAVACRSQVKEPWQWLGLDVRGPFAQTHNGHRYILTVADLYSKWVEAVPMNTCLPHEVAKSVEDVIAHFGYPVRILSRLPHDINLELKEKLKVSIPLLVHHQQTGTADMNTLQMIDSDLMEQHAADWDVYLPAQVFGLCFREHPHTKERPFSALCCKGPEPVRSARGLDVRNQPSSTLIHFNQSLSAVLSPQLTYSQIRESVFVIR